MRMSSLIARLNHLAWGGLGLALLVGLSGCNLPRPFGPPGTMETQRARAMVHDPYPSTELGPPVAGLRPRDFDQPRAEVTRLQSSPTARRSGTSSPNGF